MRSNSVCCTIDHNGNGFIIIRKPGDVYKRQVSMIGGLGTAGAFGPYYEQLLGIPGTASAAVAAATFGMVAGTILGAPVGERIIKMHKVKTPVSYTHLDVYKRQNFTF